MIAYTINNEVIVVIVDGVSRVVPRGTAQASQLLAALKQTPIDERKVAMLADLKSALAAYDRGRRSAEGSSSVDSDPDSEEEGEWG